MHVSPRELQAELGGQAPPRLIDVRTDEERRLAVIAGSVLASDDLLAEMRSWSADTPIVCYCHSGVRSLNAVEFLRQQGFTNVRSLAGGIDAWSCEVDPSVPRYG